MLVHVAHVVSPPVARVPSGFEAVRSIRVTMERGGVGGDLYALRVEPGPLADAVAGMYDGLMKKLMFGDAFGDGGCAATCSPDHPAATTRTAINNADVLIALSTIERSTHSKRSDLR